VFWFVFQVGFRNPNVGDVEYILWFSTGLIPWFFFSDSWSTATNSFLDYSYLVKKVVFKINILPMIKIISALFVHVFFIGFMFVLYALYGRVPSIYAIQLIYYMFCMIMLVIAMSFITAPLILFFRDLGQLMNIVLQFGMWLTPIMWSVNNLPDNLKWVMTFFKINPMYYIVQGYRDSMIYDVWFYSNIKQTLYFWIVVTVLMIVGSTLYRRLKPHFADVL
jgi:teichoic acid transport system permease protein